MARYLKAALIDGKPHCPKCYSRDNFTTIKDYGLTDTTDNQYYFFEVKCKVCDVRLRYYTDSSFKRHIDLSAEPTEPIERTETPEPTEFTEPLEPHEPPKEKKTRRRKEVESPEAPVVEEVKSETTETSPNKRSKRKRNPKNTKKLSKYRRTKECLG